MAWGGARLALDPAALERVAAGKPLPKRGTMTLGALVALTAFPTMSTMAISGVWHGAGWT